MLKQKSVHTIQAISVNYLFIQMILNVVSACVHMLMEQNCIAFHVPTIFIVHASAVGFGQKQLVRSANIISEEPIHWSNILLIKTRWHSNEVYHLKGT